nr:hypothetical protein [Pseudomonas sp. Marseille-Q3773]
MTFYNPCHGGRTSINLAERQADMRRKPSGIEVADKFVRQAPAALLNPTRRFASDQRDKKGPYEYYELNRKTHSELPQPGLMEASGLST